MVGKRISVYQSMETIHTCRLYDEDVRKLFGLPARKGKIISVELQSGRILVRFEITKHKYINHKLGGK